MFKNLSKIALVGAIASSILTAVTPVSADSIRIIGGETYYDDGYSNVDYRYDDWYDRRDIRRYRQERRRYLRRNARTLVCESLSGRYTRCLTDRAIIRNRDYIRFRRALERSSRCREGYSWGFDRDGLWVSNGCRAEFDLFY